MLTLDNIDLTKKYPTDAKSIEAMRDWIFQFYIEVEYRLNMLQRQIEKYHADDVFKNGTDVEYGDPVIDVALPAYIEILRDPDHIVYSDGDMIDISGIVVRAYKANGMVWVDENHPNGYIPQEELTYEPTVAIFEGISGVPNSIVSTAGTILSTNNGGRTPIVKKNDGKSVCFIAPNGVESDSTTDPWIEVWSISDSAKASAISAPAALSYGTKEYQGHTYHLSSIGTNNVYGGGTTYTNPLGLPVYNGFVHSSPMKALTDEQFANLVTTFNISYVEDNTVSVKWGRPGDKKELKASFKIETI